MAHEIDMSNGRANIAFLGSRKDVWHRMGDEMKPGQSIPEWAVAAGLDWEALKVPAMAQLADGTLRAVPGQRFLVRSDTGAPLGYVSDGYQIVQPAEVLAWFEKYLLVDSRFHLDVAGSLRGGQVIWATAKYLGGIKVVGEDHVARVLMTTTYDGSGATLNSSVLTRVVCANTMRVAHSDKRAVIRTRHSGKFNPQRVAEELATLAQSYETYKAMGEALARSAMAAADVSNFFKAVLDIPFDAKKDDVSTRKLNQFEALNQAYRTTVSEGTEAGTAWTALNAVTRYVDHDRAARGGESEDQARFMSANFGSGDALKAKAVSLLASANQLALAA